MFPSRGRGEIIKLLLEYGADKDRVNNHGVSPYALAQTIANYDVRQFFSVMCNGAYFVKHVYPDDPWRPAGFSYV